MSTPRTPPSPDGFSGRRPDGRFAHGNPGGKGNPYAKRVAELKKAFMDVVGPEHMEALARVTLKKALKGDMVAMRTILDRAIGKTLDAAQESAVIPIELPSMKTAEGCAEASQRVTTALINGHISQEAAKVLGELIQVRAKTIELMDFEKRLKDIEASLPVLASKPKKLWGQ